MTTHKEAGPMNMIERVARAVCKSKTCEGFMCCQWPAQRGRTDCPVQKGYYNDAAISAIEAMREPTEEMDNAGINAEKYRSMGILKVRHIWSGMISAALKEE